MKRNRTGLAIQGWLLASSLASSLAAGGCSGSVRIGADSSGGNAGTGDAGNSESSGEAGQRQNAAGAGGAQAGAAGSGGGNDGGGAGGCTGGNCPPVCSREIECATAAACAWPAAQAYSSLCAQFGRDARLLGILDCGSYLAAVSYGLDTRTWSYYDSRTLALTAVVWQQVGDLYEPRCATQYAPNAGLWLWWFVQILPQPTAMADQRRQREPQC
jgi:hypothetical protein